MNELEKSIRDIEAAHARLGRLIASYHIYSEVPPGAIVTGLKEIGRALNRLRKLHARLSEQGVRK